MFLELAGYFLDLVRWDYEELFDEALRAAVRMLIIENAGAILSFHQRLGLRLLADTVARSKAPR